MSIQLGSELLHLSFAVLLCLTPMSIQLGSEPLFSNLYLIVTQASWELFLLAMVLTK